MRHCRLPEDFSSRCQRQQHLSAEPPLMHSWPCSLSAWTHCTVLTKENAENVFRLITAISLSSRQPWVGRGGKIRQFPEAC
eukprot:3894884-Amphidinium_carterae.1